MILGFDAKRLFLNRSGLGNYSRWLVSGLQQTFPGNDFHLYTPTLPERPFGSENRFSDPPFGIHQAPHILKAFWRTKTIKRDLIRDKIEVYHGLSNELPVGIEKTGIRSVVTIHDLIFKTHPEYYKPLDRLIYDKKFRSACERADKIVSVSHYTARNIHEYYGIPLDKIEVIYMDCLPLYHQRAEETQLNQVRQKFRLKAPFFINVGGADGRKNQVALTRAFVQIARQIPHHLVIAGKKGNDTAMIEQIAKQAGVSNKITWLENVSDAELFCLYHLSEALLFPSLEEGFGIPILESYRCNKPVLTSNGSSLKEIAGNAGITCNPRNTDEIANGMLNLAKPEEYERLQKQIPMALSGFEPGQLLKKQMDLYQSLLP